MLPATATVTMVSAWALLAACFIFFGHAVDYMLHFFRVQCDPSSIILRCVHLTDAEAADEGASWGGNLWCAAFQAAAAVVALLLPPHRRRLRYLIEFAALVFTVYGHGLYGSVVYHVICADKGYVFYTISRIGFIVVLAVGDMVSYITLIVEELGEEEQAPEAAGQGQAPLPN